MKKRYAVARVENVEACVQLGAKEPVPELGPGRQRPRVGDTRWRRVIPVTRMLFPRVFRFLRDITRKMLNASDTN